jgi:hypothetical protein
MADTKGVRMITPFAGLWRFDAELNFLQLHITVEKTVQYDIDDDGGSRGSGPSSDPNSPAMFPMTSTNVEV